MSVKFNVEKPFESIANFCNNSPFFNQNEKSRFIEETRQYFAKKAYWDEDVVIPESYKKRFSTDVATLLGTACLPRSERMRLLATIQKVTNSHFNGLNEAFQVYQMKDRSGWGWMSMGACRASNLKVPPLTSDTGIAKPILVTSDGLTPSLQYTLDHISHFLYRENYDESVSLDVSIESLVDLFNFAVEKKIDPIRDGLIDIFKRISRDDHEKLSNHVLKYLDNPAFFNALLQVEKMLYYKYGTPERARNFNCGVKVPEYIRKTGSVTFDLPSANAIPSYWWNEENPLESIARFTDRFSVLNSEEQRAAVATIRDFFFGLAQSNKSKRPLDPKRFSLVDLKFLLSFIPKDPATMNFERHRFIAAVQKVTELQFTALAEEDQVYPLEMRFTASPEIPQEVSSGWLRKGFAKDSPLFWREPSRGAIECGYEELKPICLDQMNPLLALGLQQLQYGSMTFNEGEVAGKVEIAVELLQLADNWKWESLQKACYDWLRECEKKYSAKEPAKWDTAVASTLHNLFVTFKGLYPALSPDMAALSEESIYQTLRFNYDEKVFKDKNDLEYFYKSFNKFKSKLNPKILKALIKYSKDAPEKAKTVIPENAKTVINAELPGLIADYFGLDFQISEYLCGSKAARNPNTAISLDTILDRRDAKELADLSKLLEQAHVSQFFAEIGLAEPLDSLKACIDQHLALEGKMLPTCQCLADDFKKWLPVNPTDPLPDDFSCRLTELMKIVSARYQDKNSRVVKVLSSLASSEGLFKSFVEAKAEKFDGSFFRQITLAATDVRKFSAILASKEIQAFFQENGVTTIELFRSFLSHQIAKAEIEPSIAALLNNLENKQLNDEELKRIGRFVQEFKAIPQNASIRAFTLRTRELLSKSSLLQEIKGTDMIDLRWRDRINDQTLETVKDSITKAFTRRTFIETYIPNNKLLSKFINDRIFSLTKNDMSEEQKAEEFDREVKTLSYDAAQELLTILTSEQVIKQFSENSLASAREFLVTRLKAYMATKPATGWLW